MTSLCQYRGSTWAVGTWIASVEVLQKMGCRSPKLGSCGKWRRAKYKSKIIGPSFEALVHPHGEGRIQSGSHGGAMCGHACAKDRQREREKERERERETERERERE